MFENCSKCFEIVSDLFELKDDDDKFNRIHQKYERRTISCINYAFNEKIVNILQLLNVFE